MNGALGEVSSGGGCLNIEDQRNIEQIANAMRKLLTNPSLLMKLAKQAYLRDYGNWKDYTTELYAFFNQKTSKN
jgi:multisubunit Na+/H+ antiporter MnhG subunit